MKRIKEIRQQLDMTQEFVAEALEVSKRTYINYEQGITDIPANTVIVLAELFEVSADYLLGRGGDPAIPKNYQEEVLLDNFRACDDAEQKFVLKAAELGATKRR